MISIRQDLWLHNGHQAMLRKEKQRSFWECGRKIVLVFYPDFVGTPFDAALLPHLSQNPCRDPLFKLPSVLSQGTVRGATASQETLLEGTYLLADAGIACQCVGILLDGELRGCCAGDFQHCTPLAKVNTIFLVLGTALSQSIQPYRWKNSASLRAVLQDISLKSIMKYHGTSQGCDSGEAFAAPVIA